MPRSTRAFPLLAASACALALSACAAVGPNFKAPDAPKGAAAAGYAMAGDAVAPGVKLTPDTRDRRALVAGLRFAGPGPRDP